jgi:peptide deformylase
MSYLVTKKNKVLHKTSEHVKIEDIKSPKIKKIISKMFEEMDLHDDGVAIAAPQIGEDVAIFCIKPSAYPKNFKNPQTIFINPKIIKLSKEKEYLMEGCLSVRWLYGEVKRSTQLMLDSYDENGIRSVKGYTGFVAHMIQHEVDHLNGILFDSKAINLEEYPPEKIKEHEERNQKRLQAKINTK